MKSDEAIWRKGYHADESLTSRRSSILNPHTTSSVTEIEDYINNELEEALMNSFEEELLNNEGLAAEVRLAREIDEAIRENDIMALREKLKEIKACGR